MIRIILIWFISLFSFSIFSSTVLAVTVSVSNLPTTIDQLQETEVDITLSCSGCGDSYFRSVFYPSGSNYFGFTQDNLGSWIGSVSDRTQYFKVAKTDLVEGIWNGKLRTKPDSADPIYTGPGNYFFKVGRYTSASDSSADWSDEFTVAITGPTPTPTPTPTLIPTSTPTPSPTPIPTSTSTPTPTPKPTIKPTSTSTPTPTPRPSTSPTSSPKITASPKILVASTSSVLGESVASTVGAVISPKPKVQAVKPLEKKTLLTPVLLILGALGVLGAGLSLFWLKRQKGI